MTALSDQSRALIERLTPSYLGILDDNPLSAACVDVLLDAARAEGAAKPDHIGDVNELIPAKPEQAGNAELVEALRPFAMAWLSAERHANGMSLAQLAALAKFEVSGVHFQRAANALAALNPLQAGKEGYMSKILCDAPSPLNPDAWQPIETAPSRSRTQVLLIGQYPGGRGWTDIYHSWSRAPYGDGWAVHWARWPHGFGPSHWRPATTPAEPEGDGASPQNNEAQPPHPSREEKS